MNKELNTQGQQCPRCGSADVNVTSQEFSNGTVHRRCTCVSCGGFLKYLPHQASGAQAVLYFGLHRNKPLAEVPSDYLAWALRTLDRLPTRLIKAIRAELDRRGAPPGLPANPPVADQSTPIQVLLLGPSPGASPGQLAQLPSLPSSFPPDGPSLVRPAAR
jgi:hypothetical protein